MLANLTRLGLHLMGKKTTVPRPRVWYSLLPLRSSYIYILDVHSAIGSTNIFEYGIVCACTHYANFVFTIQNV